MTAGTGPDGTAAGTAPEREPLPESARKPERILLVGMMGAGKSTVGQLVADKLGWGYLDSDAEVMAATGLTVPELFSLHGEAAFRAAETEALRRACASAGPVVVSVAGGAILSPENRDLLRRSGRVIWLRARPETLTARVGDGAGRPLLGSDPGTALRTLEAVRRPLYAEVADDSIDVDDLSPDEVATRIIDRVGA